MKINQNHACMATFYTSVKAPILDCKRRVITLRRSKLQIAN